MTPKEKAEELVDKMLEKQLEILNTNEMDPWTEVEREISIECAKIAVEEIIETFIDIDPKLSFWQEVKQELENL